MNTPHNLYIHTPYCASKCNYCAFYSSAVNSPDWDGFCSKIISEIKFWGDKMGKIEIPTIFFGGGTPSLMPEHVFEKIIKSIDDNFIILPRAEITLESNPGTINASKLRSLKNSGMNRLSVGFQSLDDNMLKFLGRQHSAQDAILLLGYARDLGLRTSADFMYGMPNQTAAHIKKMCEEINNLGLNHCSVYELSLEPGTVFSAQKLIMPDNEIMSKMYDIIDDNLNLPRYEVSNYAKAGFECAHNQNIWDGAPYIGIGHAGCGRILLDNAWYEQIGGDIKMTALSNLERAVENIIMGLRTKSGVKLTDDVWGAIDTDFLKKNTEFLMATNNKIVATKSGLKILDNLLLNLIK